MNVIPNVFTIVNDSLKMKKEAIKTRTYTKAANRGIMYPRSYLEIKYTYRIKLSAYRVSPAELYGLRLKWTLSFK